MNKTGHKKINNDRSERGISDKSEERHNNQ